SSLLARREGSIRKAAPEGRAGGVLLYVDRATEGANAADGPLSSRWQPRYVIVDGAPSRPDLPSVACPLRGRARPPRAERARAFRPCPARPDRGRRHAGRGVLVPEWPLFPRQARLRASVRAAGGGPRWVLRDHAERGTAARGRACRSRAS